MKLYVLFQYITYKKYLYGKSTIKSGKATAVILQHNTILASEKDCKILFDALMNPPGPNQKLRDVAKRYKILMNGNKYEKILAA